MPRIALLDTSQVSDIIKVISEDTFLRPIYAGNAFATVKSTDKKKCVTIRHKFAVNSGGSAEIVKGENTDPSQNTKFVKEELNQTDQSLVQQNSNFRWKRYFDGDNFKLITAIADGENAAIGASRAAVDAGYITNDHQVGQTGKVVVPDYT